ncbi:hypothetical protein DSM106972_069610 [Dulcicalothrix desertica PCC 7102]|uniref:Uncharacterized protein n=1 Tax=Dulcicalothrix desertica PCC 7102 TaxID=232991 RepID=A0A433V4F1_9CYAN|nr:hypothetical protein [Dulcicalothrix desertica]RUT00955.1 hypothetical protein DSM106972_069610 [Dulcicalothrix desertica PCC 7102]TWH39903.1 hypothetical protein CAL7102_09180 [Dulcicalothrix desertica PCC 7102]
MEQWQFLIQKQGERAWQPLESAYAEIVEGRYRIVASSDSVNTDVEVRVIYQSPSEIPPRRRIHKRLRRTNSEGLAAVMPFTDFTPGVWEVRCSGDLMSDMFGNSWQHNLRLQVLPLIATTEITPGNNNTEGYVVSNLPIPPAPPSFLRVDVENTNTDYTDYTGDTDDTDEINNTGEINNTDEIDNTDEINNTGDTGEIDNTDEIENIDNIDVIVDEPVGLSINSLALSIRNSEIEAIVDQPVNPVWVRGDTAEQILQNLIELALPNSNSLLEEENSESSQLEQPLPLVLRLDEQSYVAQWGRSLTIRGRVKLRDDDSSHKDDTSDFESVGAGELRVELRSPLGLEVLVQQQKSIGERLLPFGFDFSVEIPASCESKLILADIYLYGALSSVGDAILLASQSFIVTADVSELLASVATAKPSEPDMLDVAQPQLTPEPEKTVSIDLELFNLAKTAKGQFTPLVTQPSPKRALPLRVDDYKPKREEVETWRLSDSSSYGALASSIASSTFPFLRKRQLPIEDSSASNILVEECLEQDNLEVQNIELENIELRNIELENIEHETLDSKTDTMEVNVDVPETTNHAITDNAAVSNQHHNYTEQNSEPLRTSTFSYNAEMANRPYVSPLIKKWMQSQGYSTSENINLEYQNYPASMAPQNVSDLISTQNGTENQREDENSNISQERLEGALYTQSIIYIEADTRIQSVQEVPEKTEEIKTASTWIAQEIVVDDIEEGGDNTQLDLDETLAPEASVAEMLSSLPFNLEDIEILPVPQINVPGKELVSGNTIRVRILLKEIRPNTCIKLWVEDCQTRWLLEGPHILTDLLPNSFESGMEVITELNIPFGCVEIRIEAVSLDIRTQLESDKASVQRTVVPPDLPVLQFDELLGI